MAGLVPCQSDRVVIHKVTSLSPGSGTIILLIVNCGANSFGDMKRGCIH